MKKVVIGIGSNLGNRVGYIFSGIGKLSKKASILNISNLYETKPMYLVE